MNVAAIGILGIKKEVVNGQTRITMIYGHTTDSMVSDLDVFNLPVVY